MPGVLRWIRVRSCSISSGALRQVCLVELCYVELHCVKAGMVGCFGVSSGVLMFAMAGVRRW